MVRCVLATLMLTVAAAGLKADEPPKELKTLIDQAEDHLTKGKYTDYFKLVLHPMAREAYAKNGTSMEKLGLIMERKPEAVALLKKAYGAIKNSKCQFNKDKTEAAFPLPKELQGGELGQNMLFELYEKKWYLSPK